MAWPSCPEEMRSENYKTGFPVLLDAGLLQQRGTLQLVLPQRLAQIAGVEVAGDRNEGIGDIMALRGCLSPGGNSQYDYV